MFFFLSCSSNSFAFCTSLRLYTMMNLIANTAKIRKIAIVRPAGIYSRLSSGKYKNKPMIKKMDCGIKSNTPFASRKHLYVTPHYSIYSCPVGLILLKKRSLTAQALHCQIVLFFIFLDFPVFYNRKPSINLKGALFCNAWNIVDLLFIWNTI